MKSIKPEMKIGSGTVTCYKPKETKEVIKPQLKIGSGTVTCYRPKKK